VAVVVVKADKADLVLPVVLVVVEHLVFISIPMV
jgi:hypothetical protein